VQLYVHDPDPKIDKPVRELKGFQKVMLRPGETRTVWFRLGGRALAYCDVPGKQWKADAGGYDLEAGASSRDIRQRARLRLLADYTEPIPLLGETPAPMAGAADVAPGESDLARGRPVTASSVQAPEYAAAKATDGDEGTRWSSAFSDPQWIAVDLGRPATINRVRLLWEAAYASAYRVQVSPDGAAWTDVYATEDGGGESETVKFAPVSARFVRMYGTKRGTEFGYSLFSLEVYAPKP
jgi:hypothetical protein